MTPDLFQIDLSAISDFLSLIGNNWIYTALVFAYMLVMGGFFLRNFGLHNLFFDDPLVLIAPGFWRRLINSRTFWTPVSFMCLWGTYLLNLWIDLHCASFSACYQFHSTWDIVTTPGFQKLIAIGALICIALAIYRGNRVRVELNDASAAQIARQDVIAGNFVVLLISGLLMGVAVFFAAVYATQLFQHLPRIDEISPLVTQFLSLILVFFLAGQALTQLHSQPAFLIGLTLSTVFVLCKAIGLYAATMTSLMVLVCVLIALAVFVYINSHPFKMEIPKFYYAKNGHVDPTTSQKQDAPTPPNIDYGLINPTEALEAWKEKTDLERPTIVFLATSGGAYRATFWTSLILDKLNAETQLPAVVNNIRLVTGASGGMVAGAYLTAMRFLGNAKNITAQIEQDIAKAQGITFDPNGDPSNKRRILQPRDSISNVIFALLRHDIPRIITQRRQKFDRGQELDKQWNTLKVEFKDLEASERSGIAPSIIFSPTLVESGAPAFFSNLDLGEVRTDPSDKKDADITSVEVFKAFMDARAKVTLATATRLNATFPYISPAISLPTAPELRRVVDAGYYDNYGITTLTAYLNEPVIKDWIEKNCAGAVIIEVSAFPSQKPRDKDRHKILAAIGRAFHFVSSPLKGAMSARSSAQKFRNDTMIRETINHYNKGIFAEHLFMRRFTFENQSKDISLNWSLPHHEMAAMQTELGKDHITQEFNELIKFYRKCRARSEHPDDIGP